MAIQEQCRVLDQQKLSARFFLLTLQSKYIAEHGQPGQFVQVRVENDTAPLLRRPISLHRLNPKQQTFQLLYEVVGKGTEILSRASVGNEIDVLGPLGKGFIIDPKKKAHILVGGGMGVAPLAALAAQITNAYILIGARTKELVVGEKELKELGAQVVVSTDDGSYGMKGLVSDQLLELLNSTLGNSSSRAEASRCEAFDIISIYACGPKAMLKMVSEIAWQKKIDCQVSMEQRMACGIGTCLGCVIETKSGYKKVCDEGPVFPAQEIIWEPANKFAVPGREKP